MSDKELLACHLTYNGQIEVLYYMSIKRLAEFLSILYIGERRKGEGREIVKGYPVGNSK